MATARLTLEVMATALLTLPYDHDHYNIPLLVPSTSIYHRYGLELLRLETAMFTTMLTQQSPEQGHQSLFQSARINSCHSFILDATWLPLHVHQS
jgi:hypothetical protein